MTCLKFNPHSLTLANGSTDKSVKYYDLENNELVTQTPYETSAIQSVLFDLNHLEVLMAASNENIKVWNIETGSLLDVIQVPQRGFCDFRVSEVSNYFLSAFLNTTSFTLYGMPYDNINV